MKKILVSILLALAIMLSVIFGTAINVQRFAFRHDLTEIRKLREHIHTAYCRRLSLLLVYAFTDQFTTNFVLFSSAVLFLFPLSSISV